MTRSRAPLSLLLLLTAVAACSDSTGTDAQAFSGRYLLTAANGAELPLVIHRDIQGRPITALTAGSITVQSRGRILDVRTFDIGNDPVSAYIQSDSVFHSYTQSGSALYVTRPRINAGLAHVDSGTVSGDAITLFVRYVVATESAPTPATLVYRRAP